MTDQPAPELIEAGFAIEVADAPLLHEGLNLADMAHALAIAERGIVPAESARQLADLLLEAHRTPVEDFPYDPRFGETYNCRERFFVERLGNTAGWLHAGRPRREAVRIAMRLRLRRDVARLVRSGAAFAEAAADVSARHTETFMADQTYLQHAQPSSFGHYLLSFAYPVLRDLERLQSGLSWVNASPGGAGCVNGSRLVPDRERTARLLGFDCAIEHTRDAMWQTDGLVDLLGTATSIVTTLDKLAEDLEIWSSAEFDYVELADAYTRGSVLMPQKRNPYALSMVRGECGVLIGRLSGLHAIFKSPSARSDNLIFAYGEVLRAIELARKATDLMTGVVSTLRVHEKRMLEALRSGFSQATDLAEFVMETAGIDYRSAYLLVGAATRRLSRQGGRGIDLTGQMLDDAAEEELGRPLGLAELDLGGVLDPETIVRSRLLAGGAAPSIVADMAETCREEARAAAQRADARADAFATAERELVEQCRKAAAGEPAGHPARE